MEVAIKTKGKVYPFGKKLQSHTLFVLLKRDLPPLAKSPDALGHPGTTAVTLRSGDGFSGLEL